MKYRISKEAAKDLESISLYTTKLWSVEQAKRYLNLLIDEIEYVSENPDSGKNYSHIREGYYRTRVKSHFIFYKVHSNNNIIEVIRVLHQKMNIEDRLND